MGLKETLGARDPAVGAWATFGDPAAAELLAHLGFDFVVVEREHAANDLETTEDMVRAVDAADGEAAALVRVVENDRAEFKRVLDCGPAGVLVPMVETAAEAREVVRATTYPPEGVRGVAGGRAADYGLSTDEYVATADERLVRLVQVETPRGVENAADIAAVDGVDGLFVGPADLGQSVGEGDLDAAVERIVAAAGEAGVPVGSVCGGADGVAEKLDWGLDYLIASVDRAAVTAGAQGARERFAELTGADGR